MYIIIIIKIIILNLLNLLNIIINISILDNLYYLQNSIFSNKDKIF